MAASPSHQPWPLRASCRAHPRILQFSLKLQLMKYTMLSLFYLSHHPLSLSLSLLLAHLALILISAPDLTHPLMQTIEFYISKENPKDLTLNAFKDALESHLCVSLHPVISFEVLLYSFPQDTRIQGIVESGDLEQLAEIVLNGDGGRLMGLKSPEPEIQAFLNNVPSYMVS